MRFYETFGYILHTRKFFMKTVAYFRSYCRLGNAFASVLKHHIALKVPSPTYLPSDVVTGWAGWALAHSEFKISVHQQQGGGEVRLCPPHYCLPTRI